MSRHNPRLFLLIVVCLFCISGYLRNGTSSPRKEIILEGSPVATPTEERIFFLETSGRNALNIRQSCTVESAARQNPNRLVQVQIVSKSINQSSPTLKLLQQLPNVEMLELNLDDFFKGTPMEAWYRKGEWRTSPYSVTHMANYVRVLSAQKSGGLYLDTDFIVLRSLSGLRNFVATERLRDNDINNAAFHFDRDHPILQKLIDYHAQNYLPQSWLSNGHGVFNIVIKNNCQIVTSRAEGPNCGPGLNVLGPDSFYPFLYNKWYAFFQNRTSDELPKSLTEAYAVHFWNKLSFNETVFIGSSQYYALLAAKYCPLSYAAAVHTF